VARWRGDKVSVGEVIDDRFARWSKLLRSHNATPLLVLSLSHPENHLVVTTCEGIKEEEMLEVALALVRAGMSRRG
jgi:hypothetical protein